MAKNLVIVESPAKARTVGRFLGDDYNVVASLGHVRDLPQRELGVDVDDGFTPSYEVMEDKKKLVRDIRRDSKDATNIYLATDPDREGEAIAWHLVHSAGLEKRNLKRVVFHEITEEALKEAFEHPRDIDLNLVNAQQTRRILDRLVGYKLSPVLWRKVVHHYARRRALSAGRVQSVALRLVVDREREIQAFVPKEYWTIDANLETAGRAFKAGLHSMRGQKGRLEIPTEANAGKLLADLEGAAYKISSVKTRQIRQRPAAPFTTSSLQQEAWRKLRFSTSKTMMLAQQLYEGMDMGDEGSVGLITYMRTDSTTLSSQALREAQAYIRKQYGAEYAPQIAQNVQNQEQVRTGGPRGHTAYLHSKRPRQHRQATVPRPAQAVRPDLETHPGQPDGRRPAGLHVRGHRGLRHIRQRLCVQGYRERPQVPRLSPAIP